MACYDKDFHPKKDCYYVSTAVWITFFVYVIVLGLLIGMYNYYQDTTPGYETSYILRPSRRDERAMAEEMEERQIQRHIFALTMQRLQNGTTLQEDSPCYFETVCNHFRLGKA